MDRRSHRPQLDGLRALAVAAVVVHHTTPVHRWTSALGGGGVTVFFVLSGYLITGILMDARARAEAIGEPPGRAWRAFWIRRALRIFPLYYAVLLGALAIDLHGIRPEWPWYAAYLSNLRFAYLGHFGPLAHTWSLAVEEQFYLLWPLAALRLPRRRLLAVAWSAVAVALACRAALLASGSGPLAGTISTPVCLDALGAGAVLAMASRPPSSRAAGVAGAAIAATIALAGVGRLATARALVSRAGWLVFSCWLVGGASAGFRGRFGRLLDSRPLRFVGKISYGVYVIHATIPGVCGWASYRWGTTLGYPAEEGPAQLAYVSAVTLAIAALSWRYFEEPILRLKRLFPYVR